MFLQGNKNFSNEQNHQCTHYNEQCTQIIGIKKNIPTVSISERKNTGANPRNVYSGEMVLSGGTGLNVVRIQEDEKKLTREDKKEIRNKIHRNLALKSSRKALRITDTVLYPFSEKEIKDRSVLSLTNTSKGWLSVYDPRLGCVERDKMCMICKEDIHGCGGHDGHIQLATPFISPAYKKSVQLIMSLICHYCGRMFMTRKFFDKSGLSKYTGEKRLIELVKESQKLDELTQTNCSKNPTKIELVFGFMLKLTYDENSGNRNDYMLMENIIILLKNLNEDELYIMGFNEHIHPLNFIIRSLPVMRKQLRPTVYIDSVPSDDRITILYNKIINANNILFAHNAQNTNTDNYSTTLNLESALYSEIETLMMGGDKKQGSTSEKNLGLIGSMGRKEGLFRHSCMGKRVELSGRTVFGPGPEANKGEVIIPKIWENQLLVKEYVTIYNIERINRLLKERKIPKIIFTDRSEKQIFEVSKEFIEEKSLKVGNIAMRYISEGDNVIYNRQPSLQAESILGGSVKFHQNLTLKIHHTDTTPTNADFDGDEGNLHVPQDSRSKTEVKTILNSKYHTMSGQSGKSLMGMTYNGVLGMFLMTYVFPIDIYYHVKLSDEEKIEVYTLFNVKADTVRELLYISIPNKLKDGDMSDDDIINKHINDVDKNVHEWIRENILQFSIPWERWERCIGGIKDSVRKSTLFERARKNGLKKMNTGNILISVCFPTDMNISFGGVVIRRGILMKGTLSSKNVGNGKLTFLQVIKKMYSVIEVNRFITEGSKIAEWIVNWHNMSIGYDSIYGDRENIIKKIKEKNYEAQIDICNLGARPHPDSTEYIFWQKKVIDILSNTEMFGKAIGEKFLKKNNTLLIFSKEMSGTKGSLLNIAQITGSLGNQMIKGSLQNFEFNDKTRISPFFVPGSVGSDNIGNIVPSFLEGLSPSEIYKHLAAARDGLVDTGKNTSNIGYTHRKLSKGLETTTINYLGQCVSNDGRIFKFSCGDYLNASDKIVCNDDVNGELMDFTDLDMVFEQLNSEYENEFFEDEGEEEKKE